MSEKELITEFLLAAEQGDADGLKSCLAKNVDINATNRQGRTATGPWDHALSQRQMLNH